MFADFVKMTSQEEFAMEHTRHAIFNVRQVVEMSLFAGISFLLMFISFPILPFVSYMRIDFSDIPILIGTVLFGPIGGIIIAAIKGLLYWLMTGVDLANFIGVFASFVASVSIVLPFSLVMKKTTGRSLLSRLALSGIALTLSLTIVMALLNWLVLTPVYMAVLGMKISMPLAQMVLFGVVPFNFIKGVLISLVIGFVVSRMHTFLKKESTIL
ncbi:membrane protein [Secundilactobacillus kimchicus JCM 15530]|uniref:Riboflavin transporter n=2 Tax=Secundilactobacillus kimchicus TaxID=528209 RepID=A0A0R1HZI0_9LACO|nr:membrane protein [Secundilactobacillus kimchicus JCM 15530]